MQHKFQKQNSFFQCIPKYSLYHFFQKKDTYKDPYGNQIRIFKMPKFLVPTIILGTFGYAYYQFFSKKETIISIDKDQ